MAQHSRPDLESSSVGSSSLAAVSVAHITANIHNNNNNNNSNTNVISSGNFMVAAPISLPTSGFNPLTSATAPTAASATESTKKSTSPNVDDHDNHCENNNSKQLNSTSIHQSNIANKKPESETTTTTSKSTIDDAATTAATHNCPANTHETIIIHSQNIKLDHKHHSNATTQQGQQQQLDSYSNILKSRTANKENIAAKQSKNNNSNSCEQQQAALKSSGSLNIINRPEQQLNQQHQREAAKRQKHQPPLANNIAKLNSVKNIQEATSSPSSNRVNLDGRRTMIKNQLYLIEQLQLENASLRNERDSLQLENEELKFQLQMISSSNILPAEPLATSSSSSSSSSNLQHTNFINSGGRRNGDPSDHLKRHDHRRQHHATLKSIGDRLNQFENAAPTTTPGNLIHEIDRFGQQASTANNNINNNNMTRSCVSHRDQYRATSGADRQPGSSSYSSSAVLLLATPLRRPLQSGASGVRMNNIEAMVYDKQQLSLISNSDNFKRTRLLHSSSSSSSTTNKKDDEINFNIPSGANTTRKNHLDSALISSTTKPSAKSPIRARDDEEENERLQLRLVEERFGDNRDQLELSAVIIQRAFRRHQICKRFRTITEQLRRNPTASGQSTTIVAQQKQQLARPSTTNESLVESLSQAANQLIANTKAAIFSAAPTTTTATEKRTQQYDNAITTNTITKSGQLKLQQQEQIPLFNAQAGVRKAFSSQQVNELGQSAARALNIHHVEAHRALLYRVGLNIFNRNPEKGISYFIAHNFIENGPPAGATAAAAAAAATSSQFYYHGGKNDQHPILATSVEPRQCPECLIEENVKRNVADFLATRRGLSREKIGLYLGNLQEKFNQDILIYYLQSMDFEGLQVDLGLRKFLQGFRLPGEAQKIERLVEVFASRYVQSQQFNVSTHNNNNNNRIIVDDQGVACKVPLLNKDEIFILSFAIIMLNTDLHSPSLKPQSRMSPQQFVNNLRGLFKSQKIEEAELIGIYQRIKLQQISTLPDHMVNLINVQARLTVTNFQRKDLIPNLCQPQRRMVCYCRVYEVYDPQKKERVGQHQREIYLFNDMILICKLARRTIQRAANLANGGSQESPLAYRNSFPLTGLGVDLFQSSHYEFGIRLFELSSPQTTLIMFNSVNKQDQVRFTRDLEDSIAEQHEMEEIKNKNIIDLLHLNFLERLRKHTMMHLRDHEDSQQNLDLDGRPDADNHEAHMVELGDLGSDNSSRKNSRQLLAGNMILPPTVSRSMTDLRETETSIAITTTTRHRPRVDPGNPIVVATCMNGINDNDAEGHELDHDVDDDVDDEHNVITTTPGASISSLLDQPRSTSSSGSSTSNGSTTCSNKPTSLSSFQTSIKDKQQAQPTLINQSKQKKSQMLTSANPTSSLAAGPSAGSSSGGGQSEASGNVHRKCSASSVFSHDSGLFVMSRDVSPNQSS